MDEVLFEGDNNDQLRVSSESYPRMRYFCVLNLMSNGVYHRVVSSKQCQTTFNAYTLVPFTTFSLILILYFQMLHYN